MTEKNEFFINFYRTHHVPTVDKCHNDKQKAFRGIIEWLEANI